MVSRIVYSFLLILILKLGLGRPKPPDRGVEQEWRNLLLQYLAYLTKRGFIHLGSYNRVNGVVGTSTEDGIVRGVKDVQPRVELALLVYERPLQEWTPNEIANFRVPHDLVALHAYLKFVDRSQVHGLDVEDWLTAENELREEFCLAVTALTGPQEMFSEKDSKFEDATFDTKPDKCLESNINCTAGRGCSASKEAGPEGLGMEPKKVEDAIKTRASSPNFAWVEDKPRLSALSACEIQSRFSDFTGMIVHKPSSTVWAVVAQDGQFADEDVERRLREKGESPGQFKKVPILNSMLMGSLPKWRSA